MNVSALFNYIPLLSPAVKKGSCKVDETLQQSRFKIVGSVAAVSLIAKMVFMHLAASPITFYSVVFIPATACTLLWSDIAFTEIAANVKAVKEYRKVFMLRHDNATLSSWNESRKACSSKIQEAQNTLNSKKGLDTSSFQTDVLLLWEKQKTLPPKIQYLEQSIQIEKKNLLATFNTCVLSLRESQKTLPSKMQCLEQNTLKTEKENILEMMNVMNTLEDSVLPKENEMKQYRQELDQTNQEIKTLSENYPDEVNAVKIVVENQRSLEVLEGEKKLSKSAKKQTNLIFSRANGIVGEPKSDDSVEESESDNVLQEESKLKKSHSWLEFVPGLSLMLQYDHVSVLTQALSMLEARPPDELNNRAIGGRGQGEKYAKELVSIHQRHARGSLVQVISLLGLSILNPLFLAPAMISFYEMSLNLYQDRDNLRRLIPVLTPAVAIDPIAVDKDLVTSRVTVVAAIAFSALIAVISPAPIAFLQNLSLSKRWTASLLSIGIPAALLILDLWRAKNEVYHLKKSGFEQAVKENRDDFLNKLLEEKERITFTPAEQVELWTHVKSASLGLLLVKEFEFNINAKDPTGCTALLKAIRSEERASKSLIETLLACGADPLISLKNEQSQEKNAIELAVELGYAEDIIELMVNKSEQTG